MQNSTTEIADDLLYAFEALDEQGDAIRLTSVHEVLNTWIMTNQFTPSYTEIIVELLVEFKMAEFVEVPHSIEGVQMPPLRGIRAIENGDAEFDFTLVDALDLNKFRKDMTEKRRALQLERKDKKFQKDVEKLEVKLVRANESVSRYELLLKKRNNDVAIFRERIERGLTRTETMGAYEAAIAAAARTEEKLKELRKVPTQVESELIEFKASRQR